MILCQDISFHIWSFFSSVNTKSTSRYFRISSSWTKTDPTRSFRKTSSTPYYLILESRIKNLSICVPLLPPLTPRPLSNPFPCLLSLVYRVDFNRDFGLTSVYPILSFPERSKNLLLYPSTRYLVTTRSRS